MLLNLIKLIENMKQTKIIATIGPASEDESSLIKLYKEGANIARINCSHFKESEVLSKINNIKKLNKEWKTNFSIMLDTKWPEIRTCMMDKVLDIKIWDLVVVTSPEHANKFEKRLVSDYEFTIEDEKIGNLVDIDCWLLSLTIQEKHPDHLICYAHHNYKVKNNRHINLPWVKLKFPWLTEIDKKHIKFWIKNWVHIIAMSFVRDASHIQEYFEFLKSINAPKFPVIAKIETIDWVENIDEIIEISDWIMVARWDLWAQVPMEKLPVTQEIIIKKCIDNWKIVIVATNMLESMIDNPTPTRAELTDVHNAVKQKVDATMLSWETAVWSFPHQSVSMMSRIIQYTEKTTHNKHKWLTIDLWIDENKKLVIKNALFLADDIEAKAIVVFTKSWFMWRTCAWLRPNQPVYAFTFSEETIKSLNINYWINPVLIEFKNNEDHLKSACDYLLDWFILKKWDKIIVLIDWKENDSSAPIMKIITL